jgi:hypothetical protein
MDPRYGIDGVPAQLNLAGQVSISQVTQNSSTAVSLEISRAKALAKFPGSGAAQEAPRKKTGLKSRQNRVNSFFPDL